MSSAHRYRQAVRSRFSNVRKNGDCWEWQGQLNINGYGKTSVNGVQYAAHRWFHEYFIGPIPDGLQIDHLCRNRICVAPWHLEAVTALENTRRKHAAREFGADKDYCTRGHRMTEDNRYRFAREGTHDGVMCRECLRMHSRANYRPRGEVRQPHSRDKTHCHRGHEFTDENTYKHKGKRICRACGRLAAKRFRENKEKS